MTGLSQIALPIDDPLQINAPIRCDDPRPRCSLGVKSIMVLLVPLWAPIGLYFHSWE